VAGVAAVAGADSTTIVRLGLSMTALQASIGTLNDLVDAPSDAGHKPGKPIPAGLVSTGAARALVAVAAIIGVALAIPSGVALVLLALVVLAIGYGYDLWAKGTAWSWLPFAVGIPILPLYGWLGATGAIPGWFAMLLPMAVLAGAGLALANARVDIVRDTGAGKSSAAAALGVARAWWVTTALLGLALVLALGSLAMAGPIARAPVIAAAAIAVGVCLVVVGTVAGRRPTTAWLERAWELQAVGVAAVGIGWILASV
jgi:geranylgeranylglycerol-phosphate geranylgeranyltransferase